VGVGWVRVDKIVFTRASLQERVCLFCLEGALDRGQGSSSGSLSCHDDHGLSGPRADGHKHVKRVWGVRQGRRTASAPPCYLRLRLGSDERALPWTWTSSAVDASTGAWPRPRSQEAASRRSTPIRAVPKAS
jgi:hypothetical protein